ncbi:HTH_Tnp_Tc3_2 domain-containing protein [Trichonephila clavipes]|nr:HTH_Tnp_Tc3_2 domain-containing protein [Trichonephila clavipes]
MDITPKTRSKIIPLNEHTSMTERDTATEVGVSKSSVSRILKTFHDSETSSQKKEKEKEEEKGKYECKRKTIQRTNQILIRHSKISPGKTNTDLRKDLLDYGV